MDEFGCDFGVVFGAENGPKIDAKKRRQINGKKQTARKSLKKTILIEKRQDEEFLQDHCQLIWATWGKEYR